MPAQWTGEIVKQLHNNKLTKKELAPFIPWNEKYLVQVLNSDNPPKGAEKKVRDALAKLINSRNTP